MYPCKGTVLERADAMNKLVTEFLSSVMCVFLLEYTQISCSCTRVRRYIFTGFNTSILFINCHNVSSFQYKNLSRIISPITGIIIPPSPQRTFFLGGGGCLYSQTCLVWLFKGGKKLIKSHKTGGPWIQVQLFNLLRYFGIGIWKLWSLNDLVLEVPIYRGGRQDRFDCIGITLFVCSHHVQYHLDPRSYLQGQGHSSHMPKIHVRAITPHYLVRSW